MRVAAYALAGSQLLQTMEQSQMPRSRRRHCFFGDYVWRLPFNHIGGICLFVLLSFSVSIYAGTAQVAISVATVSL
jgi:hypothetical protein